MTQTFHQFRESIANPNWAFPKGRIIAVNQGDQLPEVLANATDRYTGPLPVGVETFDPASWVEANKERVEPKAPTPLTEESVRRQRRLQDSQRWSDAQALNFPQPSLRRYKIATPPAQGRIEEKLWQPQEIEAWVERVQRVSVAVLAGKP
jgi:hypothetical protein